MIFFVGAWLLLLAVCWLAGCAVLEGVGAAAALRREGDRFVLSAWLGLGAVALLLLAVSLFAPLTPLCGASVAMATAAAALLPRGVRVEAARLAARLRSTLPLGLLALASGVAAFNSQPVTNFDTGLYHFGSIKWLAEHGAVRGLGLVHLRFAFTSSWFALSAPFDAGPFEGRAAALANGFALTLAALHVAVCARRWAAGSARDADRLVVFASALMLPLVIYWRLPVSASPDLPAVFLTLAVAWAMSLACDEGAVSSGAEVRLAALLLASGALGVKLSALPLVLVACLFYARGGGGFSFRRLAAGAGVSALLALPVVAYGFITSGCPLFPSTLMCSDVPWSVGKETAASLTTVIRDWARWDGPTPPSANGWNWVVPWATRWLSRRHAPALIVSLLLLGAGAFLRARPRPRARGTWVWVAGCAGLAQFLLFHVPDLSMFLAAAACVALAGRGRDYPGRAWVLAAGLAGTALTLYSAPALRFGFGYTAVLGASLLVSLLKSPAEHEGRWVFVWGRPAALASLLLAGGLAFLALQFFVKTFEVSGAVAARPKGERFWRLLLPPALPKAALTPRETGGLKYFAPSDGEQCWDSELPCTPYEPSGDVTLRDPARGVRAGFAHAPLNR